MINPWNLFRFVQLVYMVQYQTAYLAVVLAWLFHINVTPHFLSSTVLNYAKTITTFRCSPSLFRQQMFAGHIKSEKQTSSTYDCFKSQMRVFGCFVAERSHDGKDKLTWDQLRRVCWNNAVTITILGPYCTQHCFNLALDKRLRAWSFMEAARSQSKRQRIYVNCPLCWKIMLVWSKDFVVKLYPTWKITNSTHVPGYRHTYIHAQSYN